ncbi:MAG TPA: HAD-IIA family hydrolase [Ktedonobacterales bacterium]
MSQSLSPAQFTTYLLDLDGVVYRGALLLPGAAEFVAWADESGHKVVFVSNNSFATVAEVTEKLARLGAPRPEGRVVTAGSATADAVAARFPGGSVYALANESLAVVLRSAGLRVIADEEPERPTPDAVVVGLDRGLTYPRLRRALRAVLGGAALYAVNRDPRLPIEDGFEPGTGSLVAAVEYSSGQRAELIGKPAPGILLQAMRLAGATPTETLVVGDGLSLDIVAGHVAGATTALVLSGLTNAAEAEAATGDRRPELVYDNLAGLLAAATTSAPADAQG